MSGVAQSPAVPIGAAAAPGAAVARRWLVVCAALAGAAHYGLATGFDGFDAPHPMILLAALAIGADVRRLTPDDCGVAAADWMLFAGALLACMTPFRTAAAPALVCAAALAWRSGGLPGRSAGVLLAALGGWAMKDGAWAELASAPILTAEAHLTRFLLGLGGVAAAASGNRILLSDGHSFVVLRACSFLSLAHPCAAGTYALSRLARPAAAPGWPRMAAALGLLLILNTSRLVAMAASPAAYDFLHGERGVLPTQIAWAAIIILVAVPTGRRR